MPSLSCCLSTAAIRFLAVLSRPEFRLPYGWPTDGGSSPSDRDGVSMFRNGEMRPVSGASFTPGPWCSRGRLGVSGHHCRLPAADLFSGRTSTYPEL